MRQYNSPDGATAVTCFNVELTAIFGMVSRRAGLSATAGHSCQDYRPRGLGVGRFPIDAIDFKDHGRSLGSRSSTDHRRVSVDVSCFYRAMHFSAKRGIAIACRLSVRPSVRP